ncbi:MAG TPA: hypothetical protein VI685_07920 [Candidatus Angelobacter sp.]
MKELSSTSKAFITLVVAAGAAVLIDALRHWKPANPTAFLVLLTLSVVASRLRVKLPGVTGTMSMNLPFILVAVAEVSTPEALLVGCVSTFIQSLPQAKGKFNWTRIVFNFSNMALAVSATRLLYTSEALASTLKSHPLLLAVAAAGFFAVNSIPVAIIIALTEKKNALRAWASMFQLSYPFFLASAAIAGVVLTISGQAEWQVPVLLLPLMVGVFYSYRRYFAMIVAQTDMKRAPQGARVATAAS